MIHRSPFSFEARGAPFTFCLLEGSPVLVGTPGSLPHSQGCLEAELEVPATERLEWAGGKRRLETASTWLPNDSLSSAQEIPLAALHQPHFAQCPLTPKTRLMKF